MSHIIKTPNLSLFLGRRNTGKSTLMIHLLLTLAKAQKFAWVRVYSPTAFTGVKLGGHCRRGDNVQAVFDNDELESIIFLESQAGIRVLDDNEVMPEVNMEDAARVARLMVHQRQASQYTINSNFARDNRRSCSASRHTTLQSTSEEQREAQFRRRLGWR